jgi:3-oxoacyl-[acyl-carrier-protein] synthase III
MRHTYNSKYSSVYHNGKTQSMKEWATELGIPESTLYRRLLFYGNLEGTPTIPVKLTKALADEKVKDALPMLMGLVNRQISIIWKQFNKAPKVELLIIGEGEST